MSLMSLVQINFFKKKLYWPLTFEQYCGYLISLKAAVRGEVKVAVCGEVETAAVRGSLKSAGLSAVKPAGSNLRAPGYGATPGVLSASPYPRARSSRAPPRLLRFPQEFFLGGPCARGQAGYGHGWSAMAAGVY